MSGELGLQLAALQHGDHLCLIYESTTEQLAAVVPYLGDGLARGERCVYVANELSLREVAAALAAAGIDVPREIERGALRLWTERESYLRSGAFSPEQTIQDLSRAVGEALDAGFTGLRGASDMTWALDADVDPEAIARAEALSNNSLRDSPVTILCQYNRHRISPLLLRQVLRSHPVAILGETVCPNVFYEPPEMLLGQGSEADAVDWMIAQLRQARAASRATEEAKALLEGQVAERTAALAEELERRKRSEEERIDLLARERAARADAERQTAQLNAILESLGEAVSVVDPAGRIVMRNRAALALLGAAGATVQEGVAYQLPPMFRPDGTPIPPEDCALSRALRGEQFSNEEVVYVRPDGSEGRALFSGSSVRDDAGKVVLGVAVFRDVTRLRELEKMREDYVSLISHDLRNPLTALMGHAQLLQRQLTRSRMESESRSAELILKNAMRIRSMIEDLVESVRLESGYLEMHKEACDLLRLVHDVVERLGPTEIRDRVEILPSSGLPHVQVDPDRIERAIVNLITNALKYSPPRAPVVVQVERRDEEVVLSVIDQGGGIPPEAIPHLFQRFYRVRTSGPSEGLGLGLYITRLIAEAHGGRVSVESEPGRGSRFHLALPIDTAPPIP